MPKLISSFQNYDYIYLVTNYYEGKHLQSFINRIMSEEEIKFISACVIQALEFLRKEKIIHRDVCPVNIILDSDKYFNLIDFSFSIFYENKNVKNLYMNTDLTVTPPEMLNYSEFDYNSDYYRLGSIIYYLIFKTYPFAIRKKYNISDITVDYKDIKNYSFDCIDFMNKLLISNYKKRLGFKDIKELKNHHWFKEINWVEFKKKKIKSPFKFIKNKFNQSKCTKIKITEENVLGFKKYSKSSIYKEAIENFYFCNNDIIKNIIKNRHFQYLK